jgi:hypothetical protein
MLKFGSSLSARNVLSMFDQKFSIGIGSIGTITSKAGKVFKRSSNQGKVIRSKGGTSKLGFLSGLAMLPRALSTLAVTLPLTGALAVTGGALNLAAAGIGTANLAGRAALLGASGVMSAAGGLGGGGQSGNVKKQQKQMQMVQSALNKKGPTGKSGGGTGIANVQSTLANYDAPEGAMSMLPTGDEDGMGMLSGMLQQIAVNTSYLGGIDSKIDALVGLSSISVIDQAQETKGEGEGGGGQDGLIKRSFNSLKDGFSSMSSGLGGAGKSLLKGLGLIAGLVAFKKFEPQITSGLASLFENVSGFFDSMSSGADPSDGIVGYFDNIMENSILPSLVTMAEKAIELIFRGIKIALNQVLPGFLQLDTQQSSSGINEEQSKEQIATKAIASTGADLGKVTGYGNVLGNDISLGNAFGIGGDGDVQPGIEAENVEQAVRDRLEYMYQAFMKSGGRVKWTEIGKGFKANGGIDSLNGTFSVSDILYKSKPIVDGFVKERGYNVENLKTPNLTGNNLAEYIRSSVAMSKAKQIMLNKSGFVNSFLFEGPTVGESLLFQDQNMSGKEAIKSFNDSIQKRNLLLNNDGASLGNGNNGDTAMLDMSSNSQHMHETTVASLTPAYHSDLNMASFMGNNQVA